MPHAALWVVQLWDALGSGRPHTGFNAARGFVGGATQGSMFQQDSLERFNAARGFVGGATHWLRATACRSYCFNAARGFVGGATTMIKFVGTLPL